MKAKNERINSNIFNRNTHPDHFRNFSMEFIIMKIHVYQMTEFGWKKIFTALNETHAIEVYNTLKQACPCNFYEIK